MLAPGIGRDVPEPVDRQHGRRDLRLPEGGVGHVEANERRRVERGPELLDRDAGRKVGGGRREHVARVKGAGDLGQAIALVLERVHRHDAELVGGERQQPVVRPDEQPAVGGLHGDRSAIASDVGIDDGEVHADRHVAGRVAQDERALEDGLRRDAVRHVDHAGVGRDPGDHSVTGADKVVLQPEVGQERDHGHPGGLHQIPHRRDEPVEGVRRGLGRDREADALRHAGRLRPDRDGGSVPPDPGVGPRRRAGRQHDDVPRRWLRREQTRAVERHEVGAERVDRAAAGAFRGREEHPAGRAREFAQQAVLRRLAGHERRLEPVRAKRLGRARADRGDRGQVAPAGRDLVRAVRAGHDQPVIPCRVDRLVRRPLDLDQRALDHGGAERLECGDERLRLLARARDDHSHRAPASPTSSAASACGSSPDARSIQAPSSSATSARSVMPS